MRSFVGILIVAVLASSGCGGKKKEPDGTGSGSGSAPVVVEVDPNAKKCPQGNAVKDGACVLVVTPEKVEAIAQQQTRLDDLAKLLDNADAVAAPIELLDAIRQLDEWKKLAAASSKLKAVEDIVVVLNEAVKQLHALQAGLKTGAVRLGNIKGELDAILKDTGAAKKIEEIQVQVSKEVHAAIESVTKEVVGTIQKVLIPVKTQLEDVSDLVIGACAMAKLSGGSDKLKELCAKAKNVFTTATTFLADFEKKPQEMMMALTSQLEGQLGELINAESKKALAAAQVAVNEALKLPAAGSGSAGSAAK